MAVPVSVHRATELVALEAKAQPIVARVGRVRTFADTDEDVMAADAAAATRNYPLASHPRVNASRRARTVNMWRCRQRED